jgi:hypothetical protein
MDQFGLDYASSIDASQPDEYCQYRSHNYQKKLAQGDATAFATGGRMSRNRWAAPCPSRFRPRG